MLITPSPAADGLLEASSSTLLCCLRLHESACGGKSLTAWPIGLRGVVYETAGRLGTVEPAGALRRLGRVCTEGVAAAAWRRRQHGLRVAISFLKEYFRQPAALCQRDKKFEPMFGIICCCIGSARCTCNGQKGHPPETPKTDTYSISRLEHYRALESDAEGLSNARALYGRVYGMRRGCRLLWRKKEWEAARIHVK
jgi:hypothetical protein